MKKFKYLRLRKNISLNEMAKKLNVTYVYFSRLENGNINIPINIASKISYELNQDNDFRMLGFYPSTENLKINDFIDISNKLGYKIDKTLFNEIILKEEM